ncbi:MAG: hypothetical protein EBZ93_08335, partial [Actinobacteria bacterium]|nr:hypothetical protein [Actinomycetota bacterium]
DRLECRLDQQQLRIATTTLFLRHSKILGANNVDNHHFTCSNLILGPEHNCRWRFPQQRNSAQLPR